MPQSTMTSREFNQNTSRAKKAAKNGPVIITEHGKPAHVLLSFDEFKRLRKTGSNILDLISMPPGADLDIEFPRIKDFPRPVDFT